MLTGSHELDSGVVRKTSLWGGDISKFCQEGWVRMNGVQHCCRILGQCSTRRGSSIAKVVRQEGAWHEPWLKLTEMSKWRAWGVKHERQGCDPWAGDREGHGCCTKASSEARSGLLEAASSGDADVKPLEVKPTGLTIALKWWKRKRKVSKMSFSLG